MKSLLGIGECMIELSSESDNLWREGFAGDVFNSLWYAKALASPETAIRFFSAVGDDPTSDKMLSFMQSAGVDVDAVTCIAGAVPGLYKIHLDGGERSFSYWRDTSAARSMLNNPQALWDAVGQADIVYLSGITMAILPDADAELLISNLRTALKPGAMIVFDQNLRPRLWKTQDRMRDVITRTSAIADIVLPSFEDEQLFFGDATPEDTAQRYLALGVNQVIVKNGGESTLWAQGDARRSFAVNPVDGVVDTTAAGDSFNGAYLAELLRSGDTEKAIKAGQSCAAIVICNKGALVPFSVVQA